MSGEGTDMLVCVCRLGGVGLRMCHSGSAVLRAQVGQRLASHLSLSVPSLLCPQTSVPSGPPR